MRPAAGFQSVARDGKVYVRYNPSRVEDNDREAAFREGYEAGRQRALADYSTIIESSFQMAREKVRALKANRTENG